MSLRILLLAGLLFGGRADAAPGTADETFETLPVGTNLYHGVTVLNKTRVDLFISHSKGMANIKVKDLDQGTQLKLGYQIEQPKPSAINQVLEATSLNQLESDPRIQEIEAAVAPKLAEMLDRIDEKAAYAIVGAIAFVYLLFSFLCRLICVKTGNPASPLIWIPFFKQIPLLKAAGMSGWWILTNFIPIVFLVVYIVWCFKIVNARGKHVLFGIMLLLPVTNLIAFLYLALSGDGTSDEKANRNVISLQGTPRREAA